VAKTSTSSYDHYNACNNCNFTNIWIRVRYSNAMNESIKNIATTTVLSTPCLFLCLTNDDDDETVSGIGSHATLQAVIDIACNVENQFQITLCTMQCTRTEALWCEVCRRANAVISRDFN
jgi:hypothetical protein